MRYIIFTVYILFSILAFAGNEPCDESVNLLCETRYQQIGGKVVRGVQLTSKIIDQQPEPFDPTQCEASIVLDSEVGRIVARFDQRDGTVNSFLSYSTAASEKLIISNAPVSLRQKATVILPIAKNLDYKSLILSCYLTRAE